MTTDITLSDHGSVVLAHLRTPAAEAWIADNVDPDAQRWGGAIVVEPRYVEALEEGIIADGLSVGWGHE